MRWDKIYHKYRQGDPLTDEEVIQGEKHFEKLSELLGQSGEAFRITAIECRRVADSLRSFKNSRQKNGRSHSI